MKEYKILYIWQIKKGYPPYGAITSDEINEVAKQGWRLLKTHYNQNTRDIEVIIFEREADHEHHTEF